VKSSSGPRYVVGCRSKVDKDKLTPNTRVALDVTTLTIMRILPREVDPLVFNMTQEDPGKVDYSAIGGLSEQIRCGGLGGGVSALGDGCSTSLHVAVRSSWACE
jgi:26S proteasome regulatory subunit T4